MLLLEINIKMIQNFYFNNMKDKVKANYDYLFNKSKTI